VLVATDNTTQVDASITSGTGAMGAVLGGTTSVTAVNGVVTFTDLSIDLEGSAYTLDFADASTTLPTVTSAAFDVTAGSSGGGGGGGGDDDEGCSTGSSNGWFMLAGLLALLALATRLRTRES
jgi:LPXTG-motif cell wall-anchored protein